MIKWKLPTSLHFSVTKTMSDMLENVTSLQMSITACMDCLIEYLINSLPKKGELQIYTKGC